MTTRARDLREHVVHALAKVGVVWALAVLGTMFVATAAHGDQPDGGYSLRSSSPAGANSQSLSFERPAAPSTAGLALVLTLLGGGVVVLALGKPRRTERTARRYDELDAGLSADLPLALGLGLTGSC